MNDRRPVLDTPLDIWDEILATNLRSAFTLGQEAGRHMCAQGAGRIVECAPGKVLTDLAMLDFEPESKRMRLIAVQPGVTVEQVVDNTDFELLLADDIRELPPPTDQELAGIRMIDPSATFVS